MNLYQDTNKKNILINDNNSNWSNNYEIKKYQQSNNVEVMPINIDKEIPQYPLINEAHTIADNNTMQQNSLEKSKKHHIAKLLKMTDFHGIITKYETSTLLEKLRQERVISELLELDIKNDKLSIKYLATILCHTIAFCAFLKLKSEGVINNMLFGAIFKAQLRVIKENHQLQQFKNILTNYINNILPEEQYNELHDKLINCLNILMSHCDTPEFLIYKKSQWRKRKETPILNEARGAKKTLNQLLTFCEIFIPSEKKPKKNQSSTIIKDLCHHKIRCGFTNKEREYFVDLVKQWTEMSIKNGTTQEQIFTLHTHASIFVHYHILHFLCFSILFSIYLHQKHTLREGLQIDKYLHKVIILFDEINLSVINVQNSLVHHINNIFNQESSIIFDEKNALKEKLLRYAKDFGECKSYEKLNRTISTKIAKKNSFILLIKTIPTSVLKQIDKQLIILYFSTTLSEKYFCNSVHNKLIILLSAILKIQTKSQDRKINKVIGWHTICAAWKKKPPTKEDIEYLKETLYDIFYFFYVPKTKQTKKNTYQSNDNDHYFVTQNNINTLLRKLYQYIDYVLCDTLFLRCNKYKKHQQKKIKTRCIKQENITRDIKHFADSSINIHDDLQISSKQSMLIKQPNVDNNDTVQFKFLEMLSEERSFIENQNTKPQDKKYKQLSQMIDIESSHNTLAQELFGENCEI
jgi:hypothetical protein